MNKNFNLVLQNLNKTRVSLTPDETDWVDQIRATSVRAFALHILSLENSISDIEFHNILQKSYVALEDKLRNNTLDSILSKLNEDKLMKVMKSELHLFKTTDEDRNQHLFNLIAETYLLLRLSECK